MLLRTALSLVNLAALTATLVVWFSFPAYSGIAFYVCIAWVIAAFGVMYSSWGNRPLRGAPVGAPIAGSAGPASLGFCVFCAAHLPAGAARCPECGRPIAG